MTWGNPQSAAEHAVVKLLWPASLGLGTASYLRMLAYGTGVLKQNRVPAQVISVGNITVGGTGKTPLTIDLSKRLIANARKVAILSRGYKRLSKDRFLVISDGKNILANSAEAGDEPYLIAQRVPGAVVIVGAKRAETARLATDSFGCDTIVLDDGFQHFGIARDTDIVLMDYNDEPEQDHLLPAGRLREPLSGLARADWIVITKVPPDPDESKLQRLRDLSMRLAPQAKLSACRMGTQTLSPFGCPDVTLGSATVSDTKIFAFCGIAKPARFLDELQRLGANIVGSRNFADHVWYSHKDMELIAQQAELAGAELIITTEKDAVKLTPAAVKHLPLAVLQQSLEWLGPIPILTEAAPF
jgi:tetraacyldisaccharide 4'-kinase